MTIIAGIGYVENHTPMETRTVQFLNQRGDMLVARLCGPIAAHMAVLCHGMLSHKDSPKYVLLAEELARLGISSLRFDFSGRGESGGSLYDLTYSQQVADLDAVFNYLTQQGAQTFGLFGSSMGGAVAYLTAGRDERVVAIATLGAVAHPNLLDETHPEFAHQWRTKGAVIIPEGSIGRGFYDDAQHHSVLASVGVLRAPILVLHGELDDVVPCSDGHDIASAARQARLEIVSGADHQFSKNVHLRPAMRQVADFLATALGDTSAS